jgi:hypothetical protein
MLLRRLLRLHRLRGAGEQQTHNQIAPPHSITSSAIAIERALALVIAAPPWNVLRHRTNRGE